jgi:ribonuclease VapC
MAIDAPAIAAILFDEPDAGALEGKIADDPVRLLSAATSLEATIVIAAWLDDPGGLEFGLWLHRAEIEILPVDPEQAAWRAVLGAVLPGAHIRSTR